MARGSPEEGRDMRSLKTQLEDDEIIELEPGQDTGSGVTKFLAQSSTDIPGFSLNQDNQEQQQQRKTPIFQPGTPARRVPGDQAAGSHQNPSIEIEDDEMQSEAVPTTPGPATPIVTRARTVTVGGPRIKFGTPLYSTSKDVDELLVTYTPSTPDDQQQFDDDACPATRNEFRKMRRQLKETRIAHNELIQKQAQDMDDIRTLLRIAQRAEVTTREMIDDVINQTTGVTHSHHERLHVMELGFKELNEWAEKVADKANPEELWEDLVNKEARIDRVEQLVDKWESEDQGPTSARTVGPGESRLEDLDSKIERLENLINEVQQSIN